MQHGTAARPPATAPFLPPTMPLPVHSGRRTDPPESIRAWLAGAHRLTVRIREEWSTQGLAMVPLGAGWGAVRIPGTIVHAAAGSDDRHAVTDAVRHHLRGPVIHDVRVMGPTYWALTPYRRSITWEGSADTPLLGPGTYLGVPDIAVTEPPDSYWVTPPRYRHDLCRTEAVFQFILRGRRHLRMREEHTATDEEAW